ncbi:MAG: 2Fe-2S iron-sulfur cluster-binding protein [Tahibacter sp.]
MPPDCTLSIDGTRVSVTIGSTVAAAVLAAGVAMTRRAHDGSARSVCCGMGMCFECRVRIDGRVALACLTLVADGMEICTDA